MKKHVMRSAAIIACAGILFTAFLGIFGHHHSGHGHPKPGATISDTFLPGDQG